MRILACLLPLLLDFLSFTAARAITFELQNEYTPRLDDDDLHDITQVAFDITDAHDLSPSRVVTLQATPTTVYRPRSVAAYQDARLRSLQSQESVPVEWEQVQVLAPNVQDRHTLSQLARMTGNAYALPGRPNWYEIDPAWNTVRRPSFCSPSRLCFISVLRASACFRLICVSCSLLSPLILAD